MRRRRDLGTNARGAASSEYVLVLALVALAAAGGWLALGEGVRTSVRCAAASLASGSAAGCGGEEADGGGRAAAAALGALGADTADTVDDETSVAVSGSPRARQEALAAAGAAGAHDGEDVGASAIREPAALGNSTALGDTSALASVPAEGSAQEDSGCDLLDVLCHAGQATDAIAGFAGDRLDDLVDGAEWVWDETEGARDTAARAAEWALGASQRSLWLAGVPAVLPGQLDDYIEFHAHMPVGLFEFAKSTVEGLFALGKGLVDREVEAVGALASGDPLRWLELQTGADIVATIATRPGVVWDFVTGLVGHYVDVIDRFATGDPAEAGEAAGEIAGEVALTVATVGVGRAITAGRSVAVGGAAALGDDAARAAAGAASAESVRGAALTGEVIGADGTILSGSTSTALAQRSSTAVRILERVTRSNGVVPDEALRRLDALGVRAQPGFFFDTTYVPEARTIGVAQNFDGLKVVSASARGDTFAVMREQQNLLRAIGEALDSPRNIAYTTKTAEAPLGEFVYDTARPSSSAEFVSALRESPGYFDVSIDAKARQVTRQAFVRSWTSYVLEPESLQTRWPAMHAYWERHMRPGGTEIWDVTPARALDTSRDAIYADIAGKGRFEGIAQDKLDELTARGWQVSYESGVTFAHDRTLHVAVRWDPVRGWDLAHSPDLLEHWIDEALAAP